jgi:hypothetical protein
MISVEYDYDDYDDGDDNDDNKCKVENLTDFAF